ncbi:MAG TPA: response regulator [Polyangiaceae bacterium]|jgi:CheY-like chemotaxis protein
MTPQTSGRTILIIDNDEGSLTSAKGVLELAGYRVLTRSRAAGSVAAILHEKPDVVLLEPDLPGVSGSSIADMLWRAAPNSELVLVLFSKLAEETLKSRARAMGAEGFVPKNLSAMELVRRVQAFVRQGESSGKLRIASARRSPVSQADVEAGATETTAQLDRSSTRPARRTSGTQSALTRVLFVDDDIGAHSDYRRHVSNAEIHADFVMNGQHALTRIEGESPPDVIVCELMVPGVTGAELYRRALSLDATWRHRFVFVSAPLSPAAAARFARELQYQVLEKPVDPEQLREAVRYAATGARIFKQGLDG